MKVLTIDQLCKIIPKKPESISSDMTRNPESLPPWFKLPGSKTPLWSEETVNKFIEDQAKLYGAHPDQWKKKSFIPDGGETPATRKK